MFNPLKPKLESMRVILGTKALHRHDVLRRTGLKFEIMSSDFIENVDRDQHTFSEFVQKTAEGKVNSIYEKTKHDEKIPDIIIGLDTMVIHNGQMYGKPKDREDAINTIRILTSSDQPSEVYTGVVIKYKDSYVKFSEVTKVYMYPLTEEEIMGYIETEEYKGKAGSYAVQGIAGSFVSRIEGDYNNIIGLPLCALTNKLKSLLL